jgi:beta-galactosidase
MGFNAMEIQPNQNFWYVPGGLFPNSMTQAGTQELLDTADERGWAVLMPAPGMDYVRDVIAKEGPQAAYLKDFHTWARKLDRQNRPCVLMWVPSMNTGSTLDPEKLGRKSATPLPLWYGRTEELIKSVDPTRLVFHHHGGQTGDMETTNLYLNFVPLQEREEYLSAWSKSGEKPWGAVEHGPPYVGNFFKWFAVPLFTEYSSIYFGDEAYALEKEEYLRASLETLNEPVVPSGHAGTLNFLAKGYLERLGDWTAYYKFMDLFIRNTNKAYRAWGVNGGLLPWIFDVGLGMPPGYKPGRLAWIIHEELSKGTTIA